MLKSKPLPTLIRKKAAIIQLFFCIFIILISVLSVYFYKHNPTPPATVLPPKQDKDITPYLQHGDIILRSGAGAWSKYFRDFSPTDKRFSHVGIVCIENNEIKVLHSEGDDLTGIGSVKLVPLDIFISESEDIGISRLKNTDPNIFVQSAKKYQNQPFDWKFDADDASAIYCTELVSLALKDCKKNIILKKKKKIIPVDSCLDPDFFEEIIIPTDNAPRIK